MGKKGASKQPPIKPCSFPSRMTKESLIWGSQDKFKGEFKNNNSSARKHSCE